jgi:hypothetical protein
MLPGTESIRMKTVSVASSLSNIARLCPSEGLRPDSRYVILSGLRLGDGGDRDEFVQAKKAALWILGRWYYPRGYTLVLDGDIEDMRRFWLKDIMKAWAELYSVFDAYSYTGRLRKIVGERDLALLRLVSYPYPLSHGLKLESGDRSILVAHGHQASPPFVGRDYLSDYMVRWLGYPRRRRPDSEEKRSKGGRKAEERLVLASEKMGAILVEGHTKRPLFESRPRREWGSGPRAEDAEGGALVAGERSFPGLFSPGRALGSRSIRILEIESGDLVMARWTKQKRVESAGGLLPFGREEARRASIESVFARMDAPAREIHSLC